ncbi:type VII secretion protein EccE [Tsukamurella sp. 8F]|uniref:type VII secretion protein EccE n=1 Tax=unclassified Tsukamurella TaxID=2633480 RepID=UPI0023B987AB|nr:MULTISPECIES: type VII secretion protein EccE [unclassified Tsukamurella]MDF0531751.1 type VII secretion protein EccE [Tsukamurella sp. 8J]MDF0588047.1 type VII secretion protein EccE [Tsukamurella sp. 8F]
MPHDESILHTVSPWSAARRPSQRSLLAGYAAGAAAAGGTSAGGAPPWAAATLGIAAAGIGTAVTTFAPPVPSREVRAAGNHPSSVDLPGGGRAGIAVLATGAGGQVLVTALRLAPGACVSALPRPGEPFDGRDLPLAALASLLGGGDTPVAAIHAVARGARLPGERSGPLWRRYRALLGPLPYWAEQDVVVLLESNPAQCPEATARRGGDASRVAALATQRAADMLAANGFHARAVQSSELAEYARPLPVAVRTVALTDTVGVPDLLATPTGGATLTVSLRSPESLAVTPAGHIAVAAAVSYPSPARRKERGTAVGGRSDARLTARPRWRTGPAHALADLGVPAAGCGQVIGADHTGRPVTARLHGPGVASVCVAADRNCTRTLIERAVATGASVLVVTANPDKWAPLVYWADAPDRLWIAGLRYPPAPGLSGLRPADYSVTVLDGVDGVEPTGGTVWRSGPPGTRPTGDVTIRQEPAGDLVVTARGDELRARQIAAPHA